jgi:hypothetical protein
MYSTHSSAANLSHVPTLLIAPQSGPDGSVNQRDQTRSLWDAMLASPWGRGGGSGPMGPKYNFASSGPALFVKHTAAKGGASR